MLIFNGINNKNIILIYLYYIFSSIGQVFCGVLIDMKKLYLYYSFFVALDTGLYLYDLNTYDCALIYGFKNTGITIFFLHVSSAILQNRQLERLLMIFWGFYLSKWNIIFNFAHNI